MADSIDHCLLFFSGGRDSIVMLDLFERFMSGRYKAVFLYMVKGLEFQEKILRHYEAKFGIEILREVHCDVSAYLKQMGKATKALKAADCEKFLRHKHDEPWIALGYRKDESLQRRGHLGSLSKTDFIDWKYHKLFPIADWLESDIKAYIKARKLVLPVEYANGYRNIDQFKGRAALYVKNSYPEDWARITAQFPLIEAEAFRMENR
jgi:phosphoadenosine phosphosulfate reductase